MSDDSTSTGGTGMNDIDSTAASYALNALTPEERDLFETRLNESDELRDEVSDMSEITLLLGRAVTPVTPSAGLRSSIMGLLDSTPQLPPLPAPAVTAQEARVEQSSPVGPEGGRHASVPESAASGELLRPTPLARQRWFMRPSMLLGAAAAAIALVFGGGAVVNSLTPHTTTNQAIIGSDASQIFAASDVQHTASKVATGGTATVYWSHKLQRSAVILDGVTSLPSDKTYQLWYIKGSSIKSAGTVSATSNTVTQVLQGDLVNGDTIGITVEPSGGSKQPTTKPIVAIPV